MYNLESADSENHSSLQRKRYKAKVKKINTLTKFEAKGKEKGRMKKRMYFDFNVPNDCNCQR